VVPHSPFDVVCRDRPRAGPFLSQEALASSPLPHRIHIYAAACAAERFARGLPIDGPAGTERMRSIDKLGMTLSDCALVIMIA